MRQCSIVFLTILVLILLTLTTATAQAGCVSYGDFVHALDVVYPGGYLRAMTYQAPYIYLVNEDSLLTVLDAADPADLLVIGSLELTGQPRTIEVRGSVACITFSYSDRFQLVDISDPHEPMLQGSIEMPARPMAVATCDSYAYVPAWDYGEDDHGLYVVNISDPLIPHVVNRVELGSYPRNVVISQPYLFVIDFRDLWVLDISMPAHPKVVSSIDIPGDIAYLQTRDEYVFVVSDAAEWPPDGNGLYMINVSDPANPWIEGAYDAENAPCYHVGLWENYAIVGGHGGGFSFIDISDPANMQIAATVGVQTSPGNFVIDGSVLFARSGSVASYQLRDPMTPEPVASVPGTDQARYIASHGDYAYALRNWGQELCVVDVSDPENPSLTGSETLNLSFGGVIALSETSLHRQYAYIGEWTDYDAFHVIDVTDPTDPMRVHTVPLDHGPGDLEVEGRYLYVLAGHLGLRTYDILNPAEPAYLSSIDFGYSAAMLKAVGSTLYVGQRSGDHTDLIIVDAGDPTDPQIVGMSSEPELPYEYWIEGSLLYIADGRGGLLIMDVADPANPVPVSRYRTGSNVKSIVVADGLAYLADTADHSGLHIVDVSDPAVPFLAGYYPCSYPCDLELIDGHILVATYNDDLEVAPLECVSSLAPDVSPAFSRELGVSFSTNPNIGDVWVKLAMPRQGNPVLTVHDVQGRLVRRLHKGPLSTGTHFFKWDGQRRNGSLVPVGSYYLRVFTGEATVTEPFVLVR
ncbi:FlgD immunoglobulin-like domain containing protein [Candidatus Eisenbacteria bacterium]|uniref:FlgD immunoglobulin-like domain containing protein n=1 Tax=Eiseniibacteriota bacterium TaxID=2212470 RepID=A0ABV6YI83_UNCEI